LSAPYFNPLKPEADGEFLCENIENILLVFWLNDVGRERVGSASISHGDI
jgi:hypothetical protein